MQAVEVEALFVYRCCHCHKIATAGWLPILAAGKRQIKHRVLLLILQVLSVDGTAESMYLFPICSCFIFNSLIFLLLI